MRRKTFGWIAASAAMALSLPWSGPAASAAGVPQSGVAIVLHAPETTLAPGQSATATAQIANATKATVHLKLFPGVAVELANGGYKLEGGGVASKWLRLSAYKVTVPANKVLNMSYHVTVPPHTPPGYYVFGIVSAFISKKIHGHSGKVGIVVNVNMENTAPVVVHVPGKTTFGVHLSGWTVSWLGKPGYQLQTTLKNTGNAYEYIKAHVTLINGKKRTVLPQTQIFVLRKASLALSFTVPSVYVGPHTEAVVSVLGPHASATASGAIRAPRKKLPRA
jgi:hypothetical protein